MKSTDHEAPHYEIFSTPLVPLRPKYVPQHPIFPNTLFSDLFYPLDPNFNVTLYLISPKLISYILYPLYAIPISLSV
jgi:hypothetical protein